MKRLLIALLFCSLVFGLYAGYFSSTTLAQPAPIVLSIADGMPATHAVNTAFVDFKKNVEAKTNGGIVVEIYPNGQLGGDMVMIQAVQDGTLSMTWSATPSQVSFVKELAVFDIPFFFDNIEQAQKVVKNEEFVKTIQQKYNAVGLKVMGFPISGYRWLSAHEPIRKLEDLKGLKIRTMENPYHVAFWKDLGVTPTPLSSTERYAALQQGAVDGQENAIENAFNTKMYEVQEYFTNTKHIAYVSASIISLKFYNSLPDDYKTIVDEEMAKFTDELQTIAHGNEVGILKEMHDKYGVTIINELDAGEYARWAKITSATEGKIRKDIGDEIVDLLYKAAGK